MTSGAFVYFRDCHRDNLWCYVSNWDCCHGVEILMWLTFVVLSSKLYDSSNVGEFLTHSFHKGELLFILLCMWASYSPKESLGMLAAQSLTMTPETKHSPTKWHKTDNAAYNQSQWNRRWKSNEETKPSERISVVISCDSHASTRVSKHSSARVIRKI